MTGPCRITGHVIAMKRRTKDVRESRLPEGCWHFLKSLVKHMRKCNGLRKAKAGNAPVSIYIYIYIYVCVCKLTKRHHTRARDNSFIRAVCWCQGLIFPCQMTNAGWASWATQLTILKN